MSDGSTENAPIDSVGTVTLEEARRRYDDEERRRAAVESKIGTIITVDALIVSIVGVFTTGPGNPLTYFELAGVVLAISSVFIGLWTLRSKDYNQPGKDIDDYLQYREMDDGEQRHQLVMSYIVAIDGNEDAVDPEDRLVGNRKRNDKKYRHYDICGALTAVSLGAVIAQPVIEAVIEFFAGLPI